MWGRPSQLVTLLENCLPYSQQYLQSFKASFLMRENGTRQRFLLSPGILLLNSSNFQLLLTVLSLTNIPVSSAPTAMLSLLHTNSCKVTENPPTPTHPLTWIILKNVAAASQSTKRVGPGVRWFNHVLMFRTVTRRFVIIQPQKYS